MSYRSSLKAILDGERPEAMPPDEEPWEAVGITWYNRVPVAHGDCSSVVTAE